MSKYKCIIFDCDGVLVDSEPIANKVLVDIANDYGANIDLEYGLKHFKGGSLQGCIDKISELVKKPLPDHFEETYRKQSFEAFKKEVKPVEGVRHVLDNLEIPFCVASSGPVEKIRFNLELTGLLSYFENKIFSCYTINKWKPNPAVFLWAASIMKFKPNECLIIEDSLTGVKGAKNGGFDVYGFTAHDYNNELEKEATMVFDNMNQLLKLIV
ncbi:HAD family hydrolase [Flavobacteriaceae bacterium LMO-SS05]